MKSIKWGGYLWVQIYPKDISIGVKESNDNAIKMYKKFGFKEVGMHKNYFNIDGVFDNEILMDLYI